MHTSQPSLVTLFFAGVVACAGMCGCQTNMGGQTLPSAYYLRDDVDFYPAGPEQPLPNQVRAMNEYRAQQAGILAPPVAPLP